MTQNGVCAIVVTFRPGAAVLANITQTRAQVEALVVVDNGSPAEALAPLRAAAKSLNFTLLENPQNLGIAAALNQGIRWAQACGHEWVLLLDQDSTPAEGMVPAMLAAYAASPEAQRVALAVPCYIDRNSGREMPLPRARDGSILVVRSSGSLLPLARIAAIGLYREEFFIDQVDYEYCLRLAALGYTILQSPHAILTHSLGEMERHKLGTRDIVATHHNAGRRYYMTRNRIRIVQLYWRKYPAFCFDLLLSILKDTVKVLLVEKAKYAKLKNTAIGVRDAFLHRMGKTVEL
jgi:rhamnosyltransferase